MNRRGFLQTCLALCVAPAIVRAESLMRVYARPGLGFTFGTTRVAGMIMEHSGLYVDNTYAEVTGILDTAKRFELIERRYSVPEITLALPPGRVEHVQTRSGSFDIRRVWADGRLIYDGRYSR